MSIPLLGGSVQIVINIRPDADMALVQTLTDNMKEDLTEQIYNALWPIATAIETEAKAYAPFKTGLLQNAIYVMMSREGIEVSCNVPYAVYQEFGTRYIEARHFIEQAIFNHNGEIRQAIIDAINNYFVSVT
jgi:HK97 gp10 family phage protein